MGFFGLLFFIFLFVVILVVSLGFSFLRGIFSLFGSRRTSSQSRSEESYSNEEGGSKSAGRHTKIIKEDEGEYVDYEEVK